MQIGIVYNNKKKEAEKLALNVKKWLEKKEYPVLFGQINEVILKNPDFIITFGGDGFILHVTNKIASRNLIIPLIRANLGSVGALANVEPEEMFDKLQQFLMGNYIIKKRIRIKADVFSNENSKILIQKIDALNEIVIERIQTRAISFDIDSKEKIERSGDGIIFATQTGSTAYNHAAGGQVLIKDGIVLTVISPSQSEGNFSLVKPVSSTFKIAKIIGEARLVADGNKIMSLSDDNFIIIKQSQKNTYFVEIGDIEKK